jgi:hypothetical protein
VIFHLIEDDLFDAYMRDLFSLSTRFVIVYSSNMPGTLFEERFSQKQAVHVKHRCFTDWVDRHAMGWELVDYTKNPYPFRVDDPVNTSFCDFYTYAICSSHAES